MALSKVSLLVLMVAVLCALALARPQDEEEGGGAGAGGKSTLFEDIFNIPISVLQAVQRLLTNNAKAQAPAPPPEE
ncbi:Hypothetical predicted protein [Cloeon dipterum]|uniref:Uncharacterized protein n=1 Tax=Cloeon dipterum TaxID=197152 RepID=A0A8S1CJ21_9INSE|nr:Hypothetical predicted protein [Cloeon dipterum]